VRSIFVLSCVVAMTCWVEARPARAQATAGIAIEIENSTAQAETCLTAQQLSARVAHYSSPKTRPSGVRLILYITGPDAADLHLLRAGTVVSRRSFTELPTPCADRRDAVALSIALALERTAAAPLSPATDTSSANTSLEADLNTAKDPPQEPPPEPEPEPELERPEPEPEPEPERLEPKPERPATPAANPQTKAASNSTSAAASPSKQSPRQCGSPPSA
jgi:hypothetical protein